MRNGLLDQETEERLLAYFNGELDEEGRFAVEQWLNDSPENKKVYHQLEKDALFIRWANREQKVHVEDRKAMLFQQIRREDSENRVPGGGLRGYSGGIGWCVSVYVNSD